MTRSGSKQSKNSPKNDWNYEVTVVEVEAIIEQIEAGELPLAEVFERYAAAVKYLNQCDVFLQKHQQQMDLLIETLNEDVEF
ncbi:MAG: exodeoxyribonuclease VII small subunit [Coleofasciculaceae cyanobacterium]